ncbi:hypothetical protein D9756_009915 [Leucocoprinus leucothites]|uniref:NAD(P)-binding domain-containing protein n=1 Tax=Leucocoprinus leucothites TaxID=201217 RepID=A0A8H5CVB5_9AGAR|nr:hypothetical protein D9756_009915 [Leucoagaricus leucothites]
MASTTKKAIIIGGHGNVALRLAKFLTQASHQTTSLIRKPEHESDIKGVGAQPLLLSLEDAPTSDFAAAFEGKDVVYFCAGAGGKGGEERTKKVDYEGAVKVFDAIEQVKEAAKRPRLVLLSAIDSRDPQKFPAHYDEQDKEISKKYRETLATFVHWKYEADKNLVQRTTFKWTILRPGTLKDEPGTGKATIGRTHLRPGIPRDDVAKTLALLIDREAAAGLTIDLVGGETPIEEGLDAFIRKGETDFLG